MEFKTLRDMLWNALVDRFAEQGYQGIRKEWELRRSYPWGRASVWLTFIKHSNDFDIKASITIRIDSLEELVQKSNGRLTNEQKADVPSLGGDFGNLFSGEPMRWTVVSDADVGTVVDNIMEKFQSIAVPYVEKYHQLENALEIFASDDRRSFIQCPLDSSRAASAVGAALLLKKDRAWLRDFIRQRIAYLGAYKHRNLPEFMKFLESLGDPDLMPEGKNK